MKRIIEDIKKITPADDTAAYKQEILTVAKRLLDLSEIKNFSESVMTKADQEKKKELESRIVYCNELLSTSDDQELKEHLEAEKKRLEEHVKAFTNPISEIGTLSANLFDIYRKYRVDPSSEDDLKRLKEELEIKYAASESHAEKIEDLKEQLEFYKSKGKKEKVASIESELKALEEEESIREEAAKILGVSKDISDDKASLKAAVEFFEKMNEECAILCPRGILVKSAWKEVSKEILSNMADFDSLVSFMCSREAARINLSSKTYALVIEYMEEEEFDGEKIAALEEAEVLKTEACGAKEPVSVADKDAYYRCVMAYLKGKISGDDVTELTKRDFINSDEETISQYF